jgi:hypothetical protein
MKRSFSSWTLGAAVSATLGLSGCREQAKPARPDAAPVVAAPAPVDPVTAQAEAIMIRTFKIVQCFVADMRDLRQRDERFAEYERNAFTDAYAFHAVYDHPKRLEGDTAAVCAEIGEEYQRLFLETVAKRPHPARGAVLPVPPLPVDSLPEFIRAAGGATALHLLDHADLTRAVLTEATGGKPRPIFDMVSFGAQVSDVVRWGDVRYHGQAEDHDASMRESEDPTDQEAFVGRVIVSLGSFVTAVREEKYPRAAIWLGIACHAMQDLSFHHGMTRQQLAGLHYYVGEDPSGPGTAAAHAEARRWTKEIVAIAKDALKDEVRWQRLLNAKPIGYNRTDALKTFFHDDPPVPGMTFTNLATHWAQHLVYKFKPEMRFELGNGPKGLLNWDASKLIERVRRGLANSGIALRQTRRL